VLPTAESILQSEPWVKDYLEVIQDLAASRPKTVGFICKVCWKHYGSSTDAIGLLGHVANHKAQQHQPYLTPRKLVVTGEEIIQKQEILTDSFKIVTPEASTWKFQCRACQRVFPHRTECDELIRHGLNCRAMKAFKTQAPPGKVQSATAMSKVDWIAQRAEECGFVLGRLLNAAKLPFDEALRSKLPVQHGLYAIYRTEATPGEVLRAGRTKTAGEGLRQRIYQNHLMGTQSGNLRAQLVRDRTCSDLEGAKSWIRENCVVQFVIVEDERLRTWAEHYMLGVLRPRHCD
jgi:hypothetical protein